MKMKATAVAFVLRLGAVIRRIIGAPDYETYLAHCRTVHADTPPMSLAEFSASRMDCRYNQPGSRCC